LTLFEPGFTLSTGTKLCAFRRQCSPTGAEFAEQFSGAETFLAGEVAGIVTILALVDAWWDGGELIQGLGKRCQLGEIEERLPGWKGVWFRRELRENGGRKTGSGRTRAVRWCEYFCGGIMVGVVVYMEGVRRRGFRFAHVRYVGC
jgi:hypothetical protein